LVTVGWDRGGDVVAFGVDVVVDVTDLLVFFAVFFATFLGGEALFFGLSSFFLAMGCSYGLVRLHQSTNALLGFIIEVPADAPSGVDGYTHREETLTQTPDRDVRVGDEVHHILRKLF